MNDCVVPLLLDAERDERTCQSSGRIKRIGVNLYILNCDCFCPCVAEEESEPEEEEGEKEKEETSGEDAKEPRDSGCFESSENLESVREEPKMEEEVENHEPESEQPQESQTEQLENVQEQLEGLTVDEGS